MESKIRHVDVLIVGAGPVGLITAYQLARFGGISVCIIEQYAKSMQDTYGRAITLYPRSSELLDQLGLADELAQQAFACRQTVSYNAKGEEVHGRGWNFMENMKDTTWDFALVLRQKYQEEIFRNAMKRHGVFVESPVELTGVTVDETIPVNKYRTTASVTDRTTAHSSVIRCKYLIGSDGGRSSVRRMFGIPFEGSTSEDRWVRIDGPIRTNLPKSRSYCSIESPTHGNVLWAALDRGATRIGYAFTADRAKAYDVFDEAAAIKEAIAAVKPFELEFVKVDWWTIYSVGQRVAKHFFVKDCVFLAGDACHTHSSGAAQGMNTGLHDAVNLSWKLSLVLRGLAKPSLLHTYESERRPNVEKLIQYDKDISRLMTNRLPEDWAGDPDADVHEILGRVMAEAGAFSSGLGIFYELSAANPLNVHGSLRSASNLTAGQRAPDVTILKSGTFEPTRLLQQTPNRAAFHVVIFTGDPATTEERAFAAAVMDSPELRILEDTGRLSFVTILPQRVPSAYELLGHEALGGVFFDVPESKAYTRYAVDVRQGAVYLVRPDGWLGSAMTLGPEAVLELEHYIQSITGRSPGIMKSSL